MPRWIDAGARSGEMRRDYVGFVLLIFGAGVFFGAMQTVVGNRALGNPIEGAFLFQLLASGLVGVAVLVAGIVLVVQSVRHPVAQQPPPAPSDFAPEQTAAYRTPWSAIAFLIFIVLLVLLYLWLVMISSGIQGVLLQFVFFIPVIVVVLLLARWWSRMTSPRNEPPPSPK
jgi:hypothetical protein